MSENSTTLVRHVDYDGYVLRFGFGKVRYTHVVQGGSTVGVVLVPVKTPFGGGEERPTDNNPGLDPGGVLMLFETPESFDGLIRLLKTARENMVRDGLAQTEEADDETTT